MTGPRGRLLAVQQRRGDALGVAAIAQLAVELVDQVAAVREDQHTTGASGLDEAQRRDGLARAGGVLEPEAPGGVGVLRRLGLLGVRVQLGVGPVQRLLVGLDLLGLGLLAGNRSGHQRHGLRRGTVGAVAVGRALHLGGERDQRARKRVDLMARQLGAVGQPRLVLGQHALEPQQQRVLAPPGHRRLAGTLGQLRQRGVQRAAASRARFQRLGGLLSLVHERFTGELDRPLDFGGIGEGRGRNDR